MREVYGYIRVSTTRQGEQGVSLNEQRDAITQYAKKNHLLISQWFEEQETAAKRGRAKFSKMLTLLRSGKADGVVVHKVDRSARNLKDWAEFGELADSGIEVHFANESIDMQARGGRLSADIQAVVAADFIRNLREETKKGIRGRLKEGLCPWSAPIGYVNQGPNTVKAVDPVRGPLIKGLFARYATGEYSLRDMQLWANENGLHTRNGRSLSKNMISRILNNPFYMGVIRLRSTGELFAGVHESLIDKRCFDTVKGVLSGKTAKRTYKRDYLYRQLFACDGCGRHVIGEKQKEWVYYRCHLCKGMCINQNIIEGEIKTLLDQFRLSPEHVKDIDDVLDEIYADDRALRNAQKAKVERDLQQAEDRLDRLTNLYIDGAIDQGAYTRKRNQLTVDCRARMDEIGKLRYKKSPTFLDVCENLELFKTFYMSYLKGTSEEKRIKLKSITSNRIISGKSVAFKLKPPFDELLNIAKLNLCTPSHDTPRTMRGQKGFKASLRDYLTKSLKS